MDGGDEQKKEKFGVIRGNRSPMRGRRRGPAMKSQVERQVMNEVRDIYVGITNTDGTVPGREFYKVRAGEAQPPVGTLLSHFAKLCRRKTDKAHAKAIVRAIDHGIDRMWGDQDPLTSGEFPSPPKKQKRAA